MSISSVHRIRASFVNIEPSLFVKRVQVGLSEINAGCFSPFSEYISNWSRILPIYFTAYQSKHDPERYGLRVQGIDIEDEFGLSRRLNEGYGISAFYFYKVSPKIVSKFFDKVTHSEDIEELAAKTYFYYDNETLSSMLRDSYQEESYGDMRRLLEDEHFVTPKVLFYESRIGLNDRDLNKSKKMLHEALNMAPLDVINNVSLGYVYLGEGDVLRAKYYFTRALAQNDKNPVALMAFVNCAKAQKDIAGEKEYLERIIAIKPDDSIALDHLANRFFLNGDFEASEKLLTKAFELTTLSRNDFEKLKLRLVEQLIKQERYDEAERQLSPIFSDCKNKAIITALAKCCFEQGKVEDAIKILKSGLKRFKKDSVIIQMLGNYCYFAHDYERSINYLKKLLELRPNSVNAHVCYANCLIAQNKLKEAIQFLERALELDGNNLKTIANIAVCHIRLKDFSTAQGYVEKILDLNPHDVIAHNMMAVCLKNLGYAEEAKNFLVTARDLNPSDPHALSMLAQEYFNSGDYEMAAKYYRDIENGTVFDLYFCARCEYDAQNYDLAIDKLKEIIELDFENSGAMAMLIDSLFRLDRYSEAEQYLNGIINVSQIVDIFLVFLELFKKYPERKFLKSYLYANQIIINNPLIMTVLYHFNYTNRRYETAIFYAEKISKLEKFKVLGLTQKAEALRKLQKYEDSLVVLDKVSDLINNVVDLPSVGQDIYNCYGYCYLEMGRGLYTNDERKDAIEYLLLAKECFLKAQELGSIFERQKPRSLTGMGYVNNLLAEIDWDSSYLELAKKNFETALSIDPDNEKAIQGLEMLQFQDE